MRKSPKKTFVPVLHEARVLRLPEQRRFHTTNPWVKRGQCGLQTRRARGPPPAGEPGRGEGNPAPRLKAHSHQAKVPLLEQTHPAAGSQPKAAVADVKRWPPGRGMSGWGRGFEAERGKDGEEQGTSRSSRGREGEAGHGTEV